MSDSYYDFKPVRMHRKVGVTLRLDVCRQLEELADITGANRSAIVAMAVTQFYQTTKLARGGNDNVAEVKK